MDLSHIEGHCRFKAYSLETSKKPADHLEECLSGCSLVLVLAGVPRKPNQERSEFLNINAGITKTLVEATSKFCPNAVVGVMVNPVTSVVPAMARLYEKRGLDPQKIVGVTTLDVVRANRFLQEATGARRIDVPVVGGFAGRSVIPLFSQLPCASSLAAAEIGRLEQRVQDAGLEVQQAKLGKGSATLSLAYSGARFARAVLAGLGGQSTTECAFVKSAVDEKGLPVDRPLPYFSSKVVFGPNGVEQILPLGNLNEHETDRLREATADLSKEIDEGLAYANKTELGADAGFLRSLSRSAGTSQRSLGP